MQVFKEIADGLGVSLQQAVHIFPASRLGRPTAKSTASRWIHQGVPTRTGEVVKLEAAKLSGRWVTSRGAIERFLAAQTV